MVGRASVRRERGTDEAAVGRASAEMASVSLRDGEMVRVNRIVSER